MGDNEWADLNSRMKEAIERHCKAEKDQRRMNAGGCWDPEAYGRTHPRILWALRETNNLTDGRSLPDFFEKHGVMYSLWNKVAAVSHALLNCRGKGIPQYGDIGEDERSAGLKRVAVTNAKKLPGRENADQDEMWTWFLRFPGLFRDELRLLKPEVVICGGTWELIAGWVGLHHPVHVDENHWWLTLTPDTCTRVLGYTPRRPVVLVWAEHPAGRGSSQTYLASTVRAVRAALGHRANKRGFTPPTLWPPVYSVVQDGRPRRRGSGNVPYVARGRSRKRLQGDSRSDAGQCSGVVPRTPWGTGLRR